VIQKAGSRGALPGDVFHDLGHLHEAGGPPLVDADMTGLSPAIESRAVDTEDLLRLRGSSRASPKGRIALGLGCVGLFASCMILARGVAEAATGFLGRVGLQWPDWIEAYCSACAKTCAGFEDQKVLSPDQD
jgi:hypothetical protein